MSVEGSTEPISEVLCEGNDTDADLLTLISDSDRNRDPWRVVELHLPKFSSSQFGFAAYSLPQSVFVKARGICLRRVSDDLVDLESWSDD